MCNNGYVNNFQKASGCMESEYTTLPFGYGRCHGGCNSEYNVKGYFEGTIKVENKCPLKREPSYIITPIYTGGFGGGCSNNYVGCGCNCGFDDGFSVNPIVIGNNCQKNTSCQSKSNNATNWLNTICFCKMFM